jgi:hypothetical protein
VAEVIARGRGQRAAGRGDRQRLSNGQETWRAGCVETVRRLTRRWIAPAGGRGSGGGDLVATRPT